MLAQVRLHGRGGHGVVTAAELLATAAFCDNYEAIAFPAFGVERRGAPVQAFARISDTPVRDRSQVQNPDYVIVLDSSLLATVDVLAGLNPDGAVLLNTERPKAIRLDTTARVVTVPATRIALQFLGRPIMNTAILGAFGAVSGLLSLGAIETSIRERFDASLAEKNVAAARRAYEIVAEAQVPF